MIKMKRKIEIPEEVEVDVSDGTVTVEGNDEKVAVKLNHPLIDIKIEGGEVVVLTKVDNRKTNSISRTFQSKINNAIKGVTEGFEYKLKVVYKHFPMEVKAQGNRLVVSNFLGEKKDRHAKILEDVKVSVEDEDITVSGADKEKVGQTAANIEHNMQAPNTKDRRVFQDGIYIVKKPGPED